MTRHGVINNTQTLNGIFLPCQFVHLLTLLTLSYPTVFFHKRPTTQTQEPGDSSAVTLMAHKVG